MAAIVSLNQCESALQRDQAGSGRRQFHVVWREL
jgi:hypothetical protein